MPLPTIRLLLLLPWQDNVYSGWGPGPDLLAAARVAVAEVNNNTNILPGYKLEVIEARQEPCGTVIYSPGVVNIVKYATTSPLAGIVGLYCSRSTIPLSQLIGRDGMDLISLTIANSPIFNDDISLYKHMWFFLGSGSIYAELMTAILDQFDWTKIAIVTEVVNDYFQSISSDMANEINKSPDKQLVLKGDVLGLGDYEYDEIIDNIKVKGVFITFVTMSYPMTAKLLCLAAKNNMVWPNYAWLLIEKRLSDIASISTSTNCSEEEMQTILEGTLLLSFRLVPKDLSTILLSNMTYQDYLDRFSHTHKTVKMEYPQITTADGDTRWGAFAYDQIWAYSIALHHALPELSQMNVSVEEYGIGQPDVTRVIEDQLAKLDVQGTVSRIKFNKFRQVSTDIMILQIRNSTEVQLGVYNSHSPDDFNIIMREDSPKDSVTPELVVLPLSVAVVIFIASTALLMFVTFNLISMLCLRNTRVVRAVSPLLSILMFVGCYLECLSTVIIITTAVVHSPEYASLMTILCNVSFVTGLMGVYLIIFTMVLRLARISLIFNHFGKLGLLWSDKSLFVIIVLFSNIPTFLVIISVFTDQLTYTTDIVYNQDQFPITATQRGWCSFKYELVWNILAYCPVVIAIAVLLFHAIRTRSIKRKDFKDTKKINIFIYTVTSSILLLFLTYRILRALRIYIYSELILGIGYLEICFLCQTILFVPKLYPVLYRRCRGIPEEKPSNIHTSKDDNQEQPHTITRTISRAIVSIYAAGTDR